MKYEDLINKAIASEITKTGSLTFPLGKILDSLKDLNKATLVRVLNKLEKKGKITYTETEDDELIIVSLAYYHELFKPVNLPLHPLGKYTKINGIVIELNDFLTSFTDFSNDYFLHYKNEEYNDKYVKQFETVNKSRKKFNKKFKKFYKKFTNRLTYDDDDTDEDDDYEVDGDYADEVKDEL